MIQVRQPTGDELAEGGRIHPPALVLDGGTPGVTVEVDTSGGVVLAVRVSNPGGTIAGTWHTIADVDTLQEALGLARAYARLIADSAPVDVPLLAAKAAPSARPEGNPS